MNAQATTATSSQRSAPTFWSRPSGRVAALTVGMAAAAGLVQVTMLPAYRWSYGHVVWVAVLAAMSTVTEGFAIHVRVRRGGHAVSLSEIPVVIGLLVTGPLALLGARVLGGAAGLVLFRRQRRVKLAFNVALLGVQATTGAVVFGALAGDTATLGARQWLAAYAAMVAAEVLAGGLITAAIALHDDPREWRRLATAATRGVPLAAVTTSFALIGALVVQRDPHAVALLAVVVFVTFLAYRGYVRQGQGHAQVESLYAFTRALDGSVDSDAVTRTLLDQVRDQLRAEIAEILVPDRECRNWTRTRMSQTGEIETGLVGEKAADAWWAPAVQGQPVLLASGESDTTVPGRPRDGMAVPLGIGDAGTAVLLVRDSMPDLPTFGAEELRLFQALASHAGLSLVKSRLLDRLRVEVSEKEHLALHDALTGLPNRRQFNQLLEGRLGRPGAGITAVMLMDLDRFKEVNDALGHDTGDALLRRVAERLRTQLGDRGVIARLGGDEFAILLSDVASPAEALAVGEELSRALEPAVAIGQLKINIRASIGIACGPDHGTGPQTLLQRADMAMYAAKETRAGARLYQPQDDKNSAQRLALIAELSTAIERRALHVQFQPKLDPSTGLVTGAEALARWHHPEHGFIAPDVFIPLAEHSGLIRPLTMQVLQIALRHCAAWRRAGHDLHVAVNLSPNALLDVTLPDLVTRLLVETGVPATALTLEITESTLMTDPTGARLTLDRLHAVGVKLSIDDFGTGYSSLGRLRELPIHEVKIDKSFVQRLAVDHRDRAVVRSAVQLGHALDLEVVAEGVEDATTLAHLSREGCNLIQGYHISRPLPADQFEIWLTGRAKTIPTVAYAHVGV
jgi:diguanylate cyclase (GGDEF)-like protein